MNLDAVRAVADAVLWEGYLLYPYRSTSAKNRIRWQFGVLGPPAAASSVGEDPAMHVETLLRPDAGSTAGATLTIHLRHLQLVRRQVFVGDEPVDDDGAGRVSFDEAVARETVIGPLRWADLARGATETIVVPGDVAADATPVGRIERRSRDLHGRLTVRADPLTGSPTDTWHRLVIDLANTAEDEPADRDAATAVSFLGAHLILLAEHGEFASVLEPPPGLDVAAADCRQRRCWPVLTGGADRPGRSDVVLCSPIILYDHPAVAPESQGDLFDATEIDEILSLRVMTMTDEEKRAARATDPAAAAIIDRCDAMTEHDLARLHGTLRDPRFGQPALGEPAGVPTFATPADERPWWDPGVDASVHPERDTVAIDGVEVGKGAVVRIRPRRRADAQDLFYAGQDARVTGVFADVDGQCHVAVVLVDDPAAELHEWYGRYLYFAPDEIEPRPTVTTPKERQ